MLKILPAGVVKIVRYRQGCPIPCFCCVKINGILRFLQGCRIRGAGNSFKPTTLVKLSVKASKAQNFLIDDWIVAPTESLIVRRDTRIHLEPKAMDVLCHLSEHSHHVVSSEQLLSKCWPETCLGDSVVYKNIAILRKALGEKEHGSKYIQTIPKRGYRLHAQVIPLKSKDIQKNISEQENLDRVLRILNRLTHKQMEVDEFSSLDLKQLRKNNGLLLKISKRLLEYVTGIPRYEDEH